MFYHKQFCLIQELHTGGSRHLHICNECQDSSQIHSPSIISYWMHHHCLFVKLSLLILQESFQCSEVLIAVSLFPVLPPQLKSTHEDVIMWTYESLALHSLQPRSLNCL